MSVLHLISTQWRLRARLGFAAGDFLIFATGHYGHLNADFGAERSGNEPRFRRFLGARRWRGH